MMRTTLVLLGCVMLAACGACRGEEERAMTTNSNPAVATDCESALRRLGAGELADWKGLPAGCGTADLGKVFRGGGDPAGNGKLSTRPTRFRNYQAEGQGQPLQVWFDDADRAILVTWIQPSVQGSVKDLLAALGAPEKKLDPTVGYHADAYQWIYAARGLTLYVREHDGTLARISAYAPTTVEDYAARLGARDQKEYLPRGR
jgi:hypothetical protein